MHPIVLHDHAFVLLPQRALYWPAQHMLLVADLHLGKADMLRSAGIGVPQQVQHHDIARLQALVEHTAAARCLILGDLVHGHWVGDDTAQRWQALLDLHPRTEFELVMGNHDRGWSAASIPVHAVHEHLQIGDVVLSHEPMPLEAQLALPAPVPQLNVHGHVHSAWQLPGDRRKWPALVYQPPYVSLPAFSAFTAGVAPTAAYAGLWVWGPDDQDIMAVREPPGA